MEQEELGERGPEDPRPLRQEPPGHAQLQADHIGAGDDDADAGERPHRTIEAGARDPLPVELERAGPEVEERDQDTERVALRRDEQVGDRKSTRLNSSHGYISYAVFCLKKKKKQQAARSDVRTAAPPNLDRQLDEH